MKTLKEHLMEGKIIEYRYSYDDWEDLWESYNLDGEDIQGTSLMEEFRELDLIWEMDDFANRYYTLRGVSELL